MEQKHWKFLGKTVTYYVDADTGESLLKHQWEENNYQTIKKIKNVTNEYINKRFTKVVSIINYGRKGKYKQQQLFSKG